jgi:hypothetical protein
VIQKKMHNTYYIIINSNMYNMLYESSVIVFSTSRESFFVDFILGKILFEIFVNIFRVKLICYLEEVIFRKKVKYECLISRVSGFYTGLFHKNICSRKVLIFLLRHLKSMKVNIFVLIKI